MKRTVTYFLRTAITLSMVTLAIVAFIMASTPVLAAGPTAVSGNINTDTTWDIGGSPYVVTGGIDVYGTDGVDGITTLTINPDVIVKFNSGAYLRIGTSTLPGKLLADGTAGAIKFTSNKLVPTPGSWTAIYFQSTSSSDSILKNVTVEYAGAAWDCGIRLDSVSPTITDCTIRYINNIDDGSGTLGNGINMYGTSAPKNFTGNTISNCTKYPIDVRADNVNCLAGSNTYSNNGINKIFVEYQNLNGANYVWPNVGIPLELNNAIVVGNLSAATLTVNAGTEVQFPASGYLGIGANGGKLIADGTAGAIKFTSNKSVPTPGSWMAIYFYSGSSSDSILKNVTVEYAGAAWYGGLLLESVSPTITDCTIRYINNIDDGSGTLGNGINMYGTSAPKNFTGNTISNCTKYPIDVRADNVNCLAGSNTYSNNGINKIFVEYQNLNGANYVWPNVGIPLELNNAIVVGNLSAATLTVNAGTEVQFPASGYLGIGANGGKLIADGTAGAIKFTSNKSVPTPGSWMAIYFYSGSSSDSILKNVTVEYAGAGWNGNIIIESCSPTITDCCVRFSSTDGIRIVGSSSYPIIQGTRLSDNTGSGIYISSGNNANLEGIDGANGYHHNSFHNNGVSGVYDVYNASVNTINARNNYWGVGVANPSSHIYGSVDYSGVLNYGKSAWSPLANVDGPYVTDTTNSTPINVAASGVLANDTHPYPGSTISVGTPRPVTSPVAGTLNSLGVDGSFAYTPDARYSGYFNFSYKANDGEEDSNTASVSITVNALQPTIASISPAAHAIGDSSFAVINVYGTNFVASDPSHNLSVTRYAGNDRATTFAGTTHLLLYLAAGDLASPGVFNITVFTPSPGGGLSNSVPFTVYYPATQLVFSSGSAQALNIGQVSAPITVQRRDQYNAPVTLGGQITISLTTSSAGGHFYSDAAGTIPIASINIAASSNTTPNFYYKDTLAGSPTLTAHYGSITDAITIFNIATVINIAAIPGVTAPATGATPVAVITPTAQYTGTVSWSPNDNPFKGAQVYTATITLTPTAGYTLTGVGANFFTIAGATSATNPANSGVVTAVFPSTSATVINIAAIPGVTAPATGGTPVTAITPTAQYTGTVSWSPNDNPFKGAQVYTATITLTPTAGYTLTGVGANFFTVAGATSATNLANSGVVTAVFPSTSATVINIAAIPGVTAPATGGTPVTAITPTAQYTGTVSWSPNDNPFKGAQVYTATITLTPTAGYTLTGVGANFFTIAGATSATNLANSGVVTAVFPSTSATVINIAAIPGVTAPATGATPVAVITPTAQYTGTVSWSPNDNPFKGAQVYTATITLTPTAGYTLTGVGANFFTIAGATSATNPANSGVVTAVFPSTSATVINIAAIPGVTAPATGATPVAVITPTAQYTGTVSWSPNDNPFKGAQVYTATITLTPTAGYTLTGVGANFFTVAGATSATNAANSGVVTAVFPSTSATVINIAAIPGVTAPATGGTPVTAITPTAQYTGTVSWSPNDNPFKGAQVYTATITLTPTAGYTLTGVGANFFTVAGATSATNAANSGVVTAVFPSTSATVINIAAIPGVTAPATGGTPVTAITPTAQYTGTVSWSPNDNPFKGAQVYTATITLTPTAGYTLTGVGANFFTIAGATSATNPANSGVVTAVFPSTSATVINIAAIPGVTAPATGATPVAVITPTAQYTGTVSWSPNDNPFKGAQVYTATITLTPTAGYTLTGVGANFFTVAGATSATNAANSGVVTAVFPSTSATVINIAAIPGVTAPATGGTPVTAITPTAQYTGTVSWSPNDNPFKGAQVYTATITLTPTAGYTLTGVGANFFTIAGATSATNPANSGVVTAVFPSTSATVINIAAIPGVTAPATGATPVAVITPTAQYTGTVSWSPNDNPFKGAQVYTATITLTPTAGYTLTGVGANFFTVAGATSATNAANSGVVTAVFPSTSATVINIAAIPGVTAPATGGTPVTAITPTAQYTGTVSWSPNDNPFKGAQVYTATITLTPTAGYTLTGVGANFFTIAGATSATNPANSGVVTAVFPSTSATVINIAAIPGVTAPATGATPVAVITPTAQYTGTVSWSPNDNPFKGAQVYTATITLTPTAGYTLTGVGANFFTVAGATSATNAANSGVVTAVFPSTSATVINIAAIPGVTAPATGGTPVAVITPTAQYTGTVSWSPNDNPFKGAQVYTATITLTPTAGYTLTGVGANFFTVAGATSATNAANSGVVTAVFPSTSATVINIAAIPGVTAPATGGTPVTAITPTAQYTGTVSWSPNDNPFKGAQVYTATITLTPTAGYTLTGVGANFFTIAGATSATNPANSGVVTAVFPVTTQSSNPLPTTISISPTSKTVGDLGFSLTVNGTNFIASSVVRFNGANRATAYVSSTQLTATIPDTDLNSTGTFNITVFNPTPGGGESNAQTFTVNAGDGKANTTTSISSIFNPSAFGDRVAFIANVRSASADKRTPSGTVTFKDGGIVLGKVTLNRWGLASYITSSLSVGVHSITTVYDGDSKFNGSTSPALNQRVKVHTSLKITSSANPSVLGQSVTFTATMRVAPVGSNMPNGTVTFRDGFATIATVQLTGDNATFTTKKLSVGSHVITAVYVGDNDYAGSISVLSQRVNVK